MVTKECITLYNKLNVFVKKVINRDVQPQIDSLLKSPTNTSKEIHENDNLNDYTEIGFYYCPYGSVAQTLSNCPVSNAFALFVEKSSGYDNACTQTITTWNGTIMRKFVRNFQTLNGSFENSGWKPLYEDTGWKSITNASGFSTYDSNANPTRYRRIGKIVHIEGMFKNSSELASGSSTTMGTISDTSCRPRYDQYALMQGSDKNFFLLRVLTNGQIRIERYGTTANAKTGSSSWLHCYITYFVE